ncbi:MAG TPA: ATP-binding protein [Syntrophorhabdaceae bacterium]|nr:ATP-binding protein [Syntrophorhabdaceae bacterium]
MTYFDREISDLILAAAADMPVIVLTGMRQTGKSTFLQSQKELRSWKYVTLDDFNQLAACKENPDGFVASEEHMIIDEAQRCPELFVAIKSSVDRKRLPGRFILSGSANFLLMKGISESLAGRAAYFNMHPFTRRECTKKTAAPPFIKTFFETLSFSTNQDTTPVGPDEIRRGGIPPVALGLVKDSDLWFRGYEQTYLERDIRDLGRIGDIIPFRALLRLLSLRTGKILSVSELGRDARMRSAAVSNYLSLMEVSCIFYRLAPFLENRATRLIKSPKVYMSDSGLASFLAGADDVEKDPLYGALLETYVAQNLTGILHSTWPKAELFFWNIQGRHEVDFVISAGKKCIAVEIKGSSRWDRQDLSGLKAFLAATPQCVAGILAYNGPSPISVGERLWAIPIGMLIS